MTIFTRALFPPGDPPVFPPKLQRNAEKRACVSRVVTWV
jgi:hypothetical protein